MDPRWLVWAVCLVVSAVFVSFSVWPGPSDGQWGRVVERHFEEDNRLGERRKVEQDIAFLYCHYVYGPAEALKWLEAQRIVNQDTARLAASPSWLIWRDMMCMSPFSRPSSYWRFPVQGMPASPVQATALLSALAVTTPRTLPTTRVQDVFVDRRGHLYYRVVMAAAAATAAPGKTSSLEPRLVSHLNLLAALQEWTTEVGQRIGFDMLHVAEQCICAAHFGIIGSGMHFTANHQVCTPAYPRTDTKWTIWLDWRRSHVTAGAQSVPARQEFHIAWHEFPALVDQALWKRAPEDMLLVNVSSHFVGIEAEALYDANILASFGHHVKDFLGKEDEGGRERPLFDGSMEDYLVRIRLDDPSVERAARQTCRPTDRATFAFSRCAAHCDALERHLLRMLAPDKMETEV